jgi:hypothetical protein
MGKFCEFEAGDIITPTGTNPWCYASNKFLSHGKGYEILEIDEAYIWLIRNDGTRDGFPHCAAKEAPTFKLLTPKEEYTEHELEEALAFAEI